MTYTFEIVGVAPVVQFFQHQQDRSQQPRTPGVAYFGSYCCTLDAVLQAMEFAAPERSWQQDTAVETVLAFWLQNADRIQYWKQRLEDAGTENLLVSRLADLRSLQSVFEQLLN
jgi:hypothetical protein